MHIDAYTERKVQADFSYQFSIEVNTKSSLAQEIFAEGGLKSSKSIFIFPENHSGYHCASLASAMTRLQLP